MIVCNPEKNTWRYKSFPKNSTGHNSRPVAAVAEQQIKTSDALAGTAAFAFARGILYVCTACDTGVLCFGETSRPIARGDCIRLLKGLSRLIT